MSVFVMVILFMFSFDCSGLDKSGSDLSVKVMSGKVQPLEHRSIAPPCHYAQTSALRAIIASVEPCQEVASTLFLFDQGEATYFSGMA
jgi:hypothetical protein